MSWIAERLKIDPSETTRQIEAFIRGKLADTGRAGLVLGLSGGLDSAVVAYLAARAVGSERLFLLNLPERDSRPLHIRHARLVAEQLGACLETRDLTTLLEQAGVYQALPLKAFPGRNLRAAVVRFTRRRLGPENPADLLDDRFHPEPRSWLARGNAYGMAKHRLRMLLVYYYADLHGLLVIGAANRTEYLTGTFTHWGIDHCADLMPILHLYRSQLPALAEYLGVPEAIRTKPADPDLLPGLDSKEDLMGDFMVIDQVFWGLDHGVGRGELAAEFGAAVVDRLIRLEESSRLQRETPYWLNEHLQAA